MSQFLNEFGVAVVWVGTILALWIVVSIFPDRKGG